MSTEAAEHVRRQHSKARLLGRFLRRGQQGDWYEAFRTNMLRQPRFTNHHLGSGVFVTPAILLKATGSPGASLFLWTLGAVTSMCSLLVWLEFGLSIPKFELQNWESDDSPAEGVSLQSVPRSGGEKNFVSYPLGRFVRIQVLNIAAARICFWI